MLKSTFYTLVGVFLQDQTTITDAVEEQIMDRQQVYQPNPIKYLFCGIIFPFDGKLKGIVVDEFGQSNLTDIILSDTAFSFVKTYLGRSAEDAGIAYVLSKHGDIWVGIYRSNHTGIERAQCILAPVFPEQFKF